MIERDHAIQIFQSATAAVQPAQLLQEHLAVTNDSLVIDGQHIPKHSVKHVYVIGAGKAVAAMAVETEKILGNYINDGLVTTKYNHSLPAQRIKIVEGAHPVPDANCLKAVSQTLQLLEKVTKDDIVICLISGGASALWCDVPPGITLPEVQTTFDLLIRSGAAINEINTVRKHLSCIKGGQLIRHCNGARVFSLIISDVPGDDLSIIASGPTVPDASTFREAHTILSNYDLISLVPQSIRVYIEKGMGGMIAETLKPGDLLFSNTVNKIIGNNRVALLAAAKKATAMGYHTHIIPQLITGEATLEAKKLVTAAFQYKGEKPVCILQGGETTVKVTGKGKGGRNQHFVLAALHELNKMQDEGIFYNMSILSGGTDGTDGPTNATGAVIDKETLARAAQKKLNIETYLKDQDAYHFLEQTNSLLITGPTQTNVMDIMMAIVK
jgi:glycerate-2-kinase